MRSGRVGSSYATGLGLAALGFAALTAIGVASSILTARLYGIRVVGEFAIVAAPGTALWFLSTVREQTALVRVLAAKPPGAPGATGLVAGVLAFSTALTAVVALILAVATVVVLRGPVHHPELVTPALVCLAGNTMVSNLSWNVDSVLSAYMAAHGLFWVRLVESVAFVVLAVADGLALGTVWGLVGATYGAGVVALLMRVVLVCRYVRLRPDAGELREGFRRLPRIVRDGLVMTPGLIFTGLRMQSATWLAVWLTPVAAVGALSRAQVVTGRLQVVAARIAEVLFPTLGARHAAGDRDGFDRALYDTLRYATVAILGLGAALAGAAEGVMRLFGGGFAPEADAFAALMLVAPLHAASVLQAHALYVVERSRATGWASGCGLVVTLAVGVPATSVLGLTGAALGVVAGSLADLLWKALALSPHLTWEGPQCWPRRHVIGTVVATASAFAVARVVDTGLESLAAGILATASGAVAFATALVAVGGMPERDKQRLGRVLRRLPRAGLLPP